MRAVAHNSPRNFHLFELLYLAAILTFYLIVLAGGGFITARLSRGGPIENAILLGSIETILQCAAWAFLKSHYAIWFHLLVIFGTLPATWIGGRLAVELLAEKGVDV
jgi:hypothetical protein